MSTEPRRDIGKIIEEERSVAEKRRRNLKELLAKLQEVRKEAEKAIGDDPLIVKSLRNISGPRLRKFSVSFEADRKQSRIAQ